MNPRLLRAHYPFLRQQIREHPRYHKHTFFKYHVSLLRVLVLNEINFILCSS